MTNNPDLDAIRAEQQAQAWNEYDLFDRLFADNDEHAERLARWEDEDYDPLDPPTGPPSRYGDDCTWPYDGEAGAPKCTCEACSYVRAHPETPYLDEQPYDYDQCWWCEHFTVTYRTPLCLADGDQPILHTHCVDEYLSTTTLPRLLPAEQAAIDAWCKAYDNDALPIYTPATATTRSQLQ